MIYRLFVEKKRGFDVEASGLMEELKENLGLNITKLRVINRYDIEGIDEETYKLSKYAVFAEAPVDMAYDENIEIEAGAKYFAVEYLPGQYDQRADSAAQCINLININAKANVKYARLIALSGDISDDALEAVKKYYINPVDSREASLEKPKKLIMDMVIPQNVETVSGFINMNEDEIASYKNKSNFAMSEEDLKLVREYFREEKRDPTITELKVIDTYWSDHCRHTTFLTKITDIKFEDSDYGNLLKDAYNEYMEMRKEVYGGSNRDITLMDIAVIGAKYLKKKGFAEDVDVSEEINACSINVMAEIDGKKEPWLVMFKNETHNHPTEIEPFGGAATCLGGAIRDPLSGRSYVYQAMRVTGSADPTVSVKDTISGKLPQRKITKGAARGYSSYGNQIGLATGQVTEIYNPGYMAKRMEVGAVIGAVPKENVKRVTPVKGDVIILVGGRTGRDGCGGATGSSKEHTEESILNCGAEVQKGNPPVERNIQRLFRRKEVAELIKRCNDFGAGGVSVAVGELADSLDINLDSVLKKYEGLDGTEIAISESQERMAVVVSSDNYKAFIEFAEEENLEAVTVADVTDSGRVRMFWRGNKILDIKRDFLNTNGAKQTVCANVVSPKNSNKISNDNVDFKEKLTKSLSDLNCCSQKGLIEMFDSTIGAGTVLMPLGGKNQLSPALGMAAKLPVTSGYTDTATIMTYGFDPIVSEQNPFLSAMYAVVDSATKITAMGGDYSKVRLSFQEYFERLGKTPEKWGNPIAALLGGLKAQKELQIPAIGGKDSMSGTFKDLHVPPTLISFAVAVTDANRITSTEFKKPNSRIIYIHTSKDETGVIDFEKYKKNMKTVQTLIDEGSVLSTNTISNGGIFVSIAKMSVGNEIGAVISGLSEEALTCADYGSLILEVKSDINVSEALKNSEYLEIGRTTEDKNIIIKDIKNRTEETIEISIKEIIKNWTSKLEGVFPAFGPKGDAGQPEKLSFNERSTSKPAISIAKPRVFIPTFPGTNCEVDSKRAFERAGAIGNIGILKNLTPSQLDESIKDMAKMIKNSQIIMIPGGFSGGDEPDGSAKFITAVFRNPLISEAVNDLLENRDGLILGVCNGFQALIKLGLVPYGKITEPEPDSPTLTYNSIGRHVSCLIRTRIASVKSPWLSGVSVGDIHTIPVSHGEGRFIASAEIIAELKKNGQIVTQYVDLNDNPTMNPEFNPNNSIEAIEGIISPDGRIFGKMGHSERVGKNLYKNVAGNTDQKIFESGVKYFK